MLLHVLNIAAYSYVVSGALGPHLFNELLARQGCQNCDLNAVVPVQCEESDFGGVRHARCQLNVRSQTNERLIQASMVVESVYGIAKIQATTTESKTDSSTGPEAADECANSTGVWESLLRFFKTSSQPCGASAGGNSTSAE